VEVNDGIARVYLTGECNSQGSTFTLAQPLIAILQQFDEIQWVKIYDQNGETEIPEGPQNSIPACLEPRHHCGVQPDFIDSLNSTSASTGVGSTP
jgi:hypothetical protein